MSTVVCRLRAGQEGEGSGELGKSQASTSSQAFLDSMECNQVRYFSIPD